MAKKSVYYKDLTFSDHALIQMETRGLDAEQVWQTYKHPTSYMKEKGDKWRYKRIFDEGFSATLILVQTLHNKWLVVSAWRQPAMPGTRDAKESKAWKKFQKAGAWGQFWIQIKRQLGIT